MARVWTLWCGIGLKACARMSALLLGATWEQGGLVCFSLVSVLAQECGCAEHPRCVQRNGMSRGAETWGLLWSCVKESCGRGMEGLSWPESSWFFPSREIGAGCEGREGEQCLPLKQSTSQKMAATQPLGFYFFNIYQALLAIPLVVSHSLMESGFGCLPDWLSIYTWTQSLCGDLT